MKKILFLVIIGICLFISISLIGSIINLWQKQDLIENAKIRLAKEQEENKELKRKLAISSTENFLEEEVRNKLFMVKSGEKTVVIPESLLKKSDVIKTGKEASISNPQAWFQLFF